MSGDNLHGKQPIKFYSEKITLTKAELLERQLSLGDKISDLDQKHKEWSKKLLGSSNMMNFNYFLIFLFALSKNFSVNY